MPNRESQARGSRALSIDRIGYDQPANGAGEFAHLVRIDYRRRQSGLGQSSSNDTLITAASFQNDKARSPQSPHQLGQAIGIGRAIECGARRPDLDIDPRFRNIDADDAIGFGLDIHHPASSMQARAQTTVRVHGMPAGAARSLTASKIRTNSGL